MHRCRFQTFILSNIDIYTLKWWRKGTTWCLKRSPECRNFSVWCCIDTSVGMKQSNFTPTLCISFTLYFYCTPCQREILSILLLYLLVTLQLGGLGSPPPQYSEHQYHLIKWKFLTFASIYGVIVSNFVKIKVFNAFILGGGRVGLLMYVFYILRGTCLLCPSRNLHLSWQ